MTPRKTDLRITLELLFELKDQYDTMMIRHKLKETQYGRTISREVEDWLREMEWYD